MKVDWNPNDLKEYLEKKFVPLHFRVSRMPIFDVAVIEKEHGGRSFVREVQLAVNEWFEANYNRKNYVKWYGYIECDENGLVSYDSF